MTIRSISRWVAALAFISLSVPQVTAAQDPSLSQPDGLLDASPHHRPHMLSFFLTVPYYSGWGFGLGGRYQLPLLHDGFLPKVNDSLELEFGADIYYAGSYCYYGGCGAVGAGLTIPLELMWTFHLVPKLDFYGKLGLGVNFYFGRGFYVAGVFGPLWFHTAAGLIYELTPSISLRVEAGWPTFRIGIGIPL